MALFDGNPSLTGGFPQQRASNMKSVSISFNGLRTCNIYWIIIWHSVQHDRIWSAVKHWRDFREFVNSWMVCLWRPICSELYVINKMPSLHHRYEAVIWFLIISVSIVRWGMLLPSTEIPRKRIWGPVQVCSETPSRPRYNTVKYNTILHTGPHWHG